jgi:hypothetical protein
MRGFIVIFWIAIPVFADPLPLTENQKLAEKAHDEKVAGAWCTGLGLASLTVALGTLIPAALPYHEPDYCQYQDCTPRNIGAGIGKDILWVAAAFAGSAALVQLGVGIPLLAASARHERQAKAASLTLAPNRVAFALTF